MTPGIDQGITALLDVAVWAEALLEEDDQFEEMANTAPVMLWMTGRNGEATFVNDQWTDLTGRSLHETLGKGWVESVHPDDVPMLTNLPLADTPEAAPVHVEYRLRRFDGQFRWISANGVPRSEWPI